MFRQLKKNIQIISKQTCRKENLKKKKTKITEMNISLLDLPTDLR